MATKPASKPAWIPNDDPVKIIEPTTNKKNNGWDIEEKPPSQFFNWFWNIMGKWVNYFAGAVEYNIIIDSVNTTEADYATLAAYLADAPATSDRVLVKTSETLTTVATIPAGILLRFLKGVEITIATAVNAFSFGDEVDIEGTLKVLLTHPSGTIAKVVQFSGDDSISSNIFVVHTGAGNVTNVFELLAGSEANRVIGSYARVGSPGTVVSASIDNSGNATNELIIRERP